MLLKYFFAWIPMLILAILNGALRELVYKKYTGEMAAHQLSTLSLLLLFGIYIYFFIKKFPPDSQNQALLIGMFWLALTLLFEFGFGLLQGRTWQEMGNEYDLNQGRIWILVPLWVGIAPFILLMTRKKE